MTLTFRNDGSTFTFKLEALPKDPAPFCVNISGLPKMVFTVEGNSSTNGRGAEVTFYGGGTGMMDIEITGKCGGGMRLHRKIGNGDMLLLKTDGNGSNFAKCSKRKLSFWRTW